MKPYHQKIFCTTRNSIGKPFSKTSIFFFAALLISCTLIAQINGKLVNEKGDPISLASIKIKESVKTTVSNEKGEFAFKNAKNTATLIISHIGYQTQEYILTGKTAPLVIQMKASAAELNAVEVISDGYHDIPKERATGSFVKIDNATLNQQTGTNILKRLDGVTSGLSFVIGKQNSNPQNKTNISIRGLSTINGPLDPLIVLDGFIYEGDINNINPNDVDNITVLKDATATSIWGARAGNGVIVITSKKGKFNQPLQIGFNANTIITEKPDLFSLRQMSSSDYIDVEQFAFNQGVFDGQISGNPYQSLTPAVDIFLQRRNGTISAADSASQINKLKSIDSRNGYLKYFYTKPITQQYALNIRGGSNNNAYLFSMGYDKSIGETYNHSRKINIKIENTFKPFKNLTLNLGAYYTNAQSSSGRNVTYNSLQPGGRPIPYLRFTNDNGNPVPVATGLSSGYTDTAGAGQLLNWKYYPLDDYKHDKGTTNQQEVFANIGINYHVNNFLDIDVKYQYQQQQSKAEQLSDAESFNARGLINTFSQIDWGSGTVTRAVPLGGIKTENISNTGSQTLRGQLNAHKNWINHDFSIIAGAETRETKTDGSGNTIYGYNSDPLTFTNVDFVNFYPTYIYGDYSQISGAPVVYPVITNRFVSVYSNASYTFKRKYILSASARRDGSNIFGSTTNDRWKPLWSIGAAWKISDEPFFRVPFISALKLRSTYGFSGNVDLSKTASAVALYNSGSDVTNIPYTRIQTLNNPSLKWEQTRMINIALDFDLKGNRLSGSIEYYRKKGTDLYGPTPYDYTAWGATSTITRNVANMSGNGVDIILNSKNINRAFKWNTTLLFNYNDSKTTHYESEESKSVLTFFGGGDIITPVIGEPLYALAAYKWGGLDASGNPLGYVNGKKSTDYQAISDEAISKGTDGNIVYVGSANPTVFGSIINSFSWRNFSLSANISYKGGYYFRKNSISYSGLINYGAGNKDYENRWQKAGDEAHTSVPSFVYPSNELRDGFYSLSEVNVLKADNIRLQYINFSYNLNQSDWKKLPVKDIQIYFNAANLGILWKANKAGLDPDYPNSIRLPRAYTVGIRINY